MDSHGTWLNVTPSSAEAAVTRRRAAPLLVSRVMPSLLFLSRRAKPRPESLGTDIARSAGGMLQAP
jgi:hypothetical protein